MEKIVYREDIVEYRNFLSEKECDEIVSYLVSGNDGWQTTCFYNSAVMDIRYPWEKDNTLTINEDYFKELKSKMHVLAEDASGKKLRNLSMSAHKWDIGAYAGDHSDNSDLEGNPNAWQDNPASHARDRSAWIDAAICRPRQ